MAQKYSSNFVRSNVRSTGAIAQIKDAYGPSFACSFKELEHKTSELISAYEASTRPDGVTGTIYKATDAIGITSPENRANKRHNGLMAMAARLETRLELGLSEVEESYREMRDVRCKRAAAYIELKERKTLIDRCEEEAKLKVDKEQLVQQLSAIDPSDVNYLSSESHLSSIEEELERISEDQSRLSDEQVEAADIVFSMDERYTAIETSKNIMCMMTRKLRSAKQQMYAQATKEGIYSPSGISSVIKSLKEMKDAAVLLEKGSKGMAHDKFMEQYINIISESPDYSAARSKKTDFGKSLKEQLAQMNKESVERANEIMSRIRQH